MFSYYWGGRGIVIMFLSTVSYVKDTEKEK